LAPELEQRLTEGLAQLGVAAGQRPTGALLRYLELMRQWNKAYNLTSITDPDDMVVRHLLDSATARPYLHGGAILDLGTGAGLPGIPLALLEPSRQFTLLDSVGKKLRFLRQVVTELRLANVVLVHARVEDWRPQGTFDTVICRAFGSLAEFARLCAALPAPGGRLVAMKGRLPTAEIAGLPPGWRTAAVEPVTVPGLNAERHIVVLERQAHG
jgi:16S rRNA (guanine527-N7)-methyltransferase